MLFWGGEHEASKGYVAGMDREKFPKVGAGGKVFATLRPAGKVMVDQEIYDALSTGEYIEEGDAIVIVRIEEGVLFVERKQGSFS